MMKPMKSSTTDNNTFYAAVLESDCQAKYFKTLIGAWNYIETAYRNKYSLNNKDIHQLFTENQIDGFGWIEECHFENYR